MSSNGGRVKPRFHPDEPLGEALSYLRELGYEDLYLSPTGDAAAVSEVSELPAASGREVRLAEVEAEALVCEQCELSGGRKTVVFGSGNRDAELMFIGEGPGAQEDLQGLPFVGPAGELLTKIIEAIGMRREDVYIANIVKCRPPGNRDPKPEEISACRGYLEQQVHLVQPQVIVALGKVAAQTLLGNNLALGKMRGEWYSFLETDLRVTYHPAALLRSASWKRPTWEDMQIVRDRLESGRN